MVGRLADKQKTPNHANSQLFETVSLDVKRYGCWIFLYEFLNWQAMKCYFSKLTGSFCSAVSERALALQQNSAGIILLRVNTKHFSYHPSAFMLASLLCAAADPLFSQPRHLIVAPTWAAGQASEHLRRGVGPVVGALRLSLFNYLHHQNSVGYKREKKKKN